jgi:hypothetical protein
MAACFPEHALGTASKKAECFSHEHVDPNNFPDMFSHPSGVLADKKLG